MKPKLPLPFRFHALYIISEWAVLQQRPSHSQSIPCGERDWGEPVLLSVRQCVHVGVAMLVYICIHTYIAILILNDYLRQIHLHSIFLYFQGYPVAVLWYSFIMIAMQVHIFTLIFAWKLILAWKNRGAAKKGQQIDKSKSHIAIQPEIT